MQVKGFRVKSAALLSLFFCLSLTGCEVQFNNDPRHFGRAHPGELSAEDAVAQRAKSPYSAFAHPEAVEKPEAGQPLTSTGGQQLEASKLRYGTANSP